MDKETTMPSRWLDQNAPAIILAIAGGLADFLLSDDHSWFSLLVSLFIAGFIGYLTLLVCREWGVSDNLLGVYCGISGASSRVIFARGQKLAILWMDKRFKNLDK